MGEREERESERHPSTQEVEAPSIIPIPPVIPPHTICGNPKDIDLIISCAEHTKQPPCSVRDMIRSRTLVVMNYPVKRQIKVPSRISLKVYQTSQIRKSIHFFVCKYRPISKQPITKSKTNETI